MSEMFAGREVNVTYNADVSGYTRTLGEAIATTEKYTEVVEGVQGVLPKMTMAAAKAVSGGLTKEFMRPAVQEAAAYEQALSGITTRAKAAGKSVTDMGGDVRKLAREMPIGLSGAIEQFEVLTKSGQAANTDLAKMAAATTQLGAATGELGGNLTSQFTQFQRTFKQMSGGEFRAMSDSLTKVTTEMGASATAALTFANNVAPMAQAVGITATEVTGISTAFASVGEEGYRAANVFSGMVSDIQRVVRDGGPELVGYADAVGTTADSFRRLAGENPTEAITQFFEAVAKGGPEAQRIMEGIGLGSLREQRTIQAVAQGGGLRKAIETAQEGWNSGAAATQGEEAMSGLNDTMTKLNERLRQVVEGGGRPYMGLLTGAMGAASNVAEVGAGVAQSDFMQTALTAGLLARGGLGSMMGAGKLGYGVASGAAIPGVVGGLKKLGGFASAQRIPLLAGGAGALAAGSMMDNPLLTFGGLAALTAATTPGTWKAAKWGVGKAVDVGYTSVMKGASDRIWGSGSGMGPTSGSASMARSATNVGVAADRMKAAGGLAAAQAATFLTYGFKDPGEAARIARDVNKTNAQYVKERSKMVKEVAAGTRTQADLTKLDKARVDYLKGAEGRAVDPSRRALRGAGRETARFAGMTALSGLGTGLSAIFSPVGLAVGAAALIGGGIYGRRQESSEAEERRLDPTSSVARQFAEKTGQAMKPIEEFTKSLDQSALAVEDFADALAVDPNEMNIVRTQDEKYRNFKLPLGVETDEQLASLVLATSGNQGKGSIQEALLGIAAQRDRDTANRVGELLRGRTGASGAGSASEAMRRIGDDSSRLATSGLQTGQGYSDDVNWFGRFVGTLANEFKGSYQGRDEMQTQMKGYGEQAATALTEVRMLQGDEAFVREAKETVRTAFEDFVDRFPNAQNLGAGKENQQDKTLINNFLTGLSTSGAMTEAERAEIMTQVESDESPGGDQITRDEITWIMEDSTWAKSLETMVANSSQTQTLIADLRDSNTSIDKMTSDALQWQVDNQLNSDDMETLLKTGSVENEQGDTVYAPRWLRNNQPLQDQVMGLLFSNDVSQSRAAASALLAPKGMGGFGGDARRMVMTASQGLMEGEYAQDSTMGSRLRAQIYQGMQALPLQQAQTTSAGGLVLGLQSTMGSMQALKDKPNMSEADEQMFAQLRGQYFNTMTEIVNFAKQRMTMWREYEVQTQRAYEDFYRNQAFAQEQHQKQMAWAEDDYYQQRGWQVQDYNDEMRWRQEDFQRQMAQSEKDFYRQRQYQAEDFAKNFADPWAFDAGVSGQTMDSMQFNSDFEVEQIRDQWKVLKEFKKKGLDQDTIDFWGLADPQRANDVALWDASNYTRKEIRGFNRSAAERGEIGEEWMDEDNKSNVEGTRALKEYGVQRRRAYNQFLRETDRTELKFARSLERSDERFEKSMSRQAELFADQMAKNREDFSISMRNARQDVARATTDITVSFSEAMGVITEELNDAGGDWRTKTDKGMRGIYSETKGGWKDATGLHKDAINWVYRAYQQLAEAGLVPDSWAPGTAPKRANTGGGAPRGRESADGADQRATATPPNTDTSATQRSALSAPRSGRRSKNSFGTRSAVSLPPLGGRYSGEEDGGGGSSGGSGDAIGEAGGNLPGVYSGQAIAKTNPQPMIDTAKDNFQKFLDSTWAWATADRVPKKLEGEQNLATANLRPWAEELGYVILKQFPQVKNIGGWRPSDPYDDHPSGNALDVMMPYGDTVNYDDASTKDQQLGNAIYKWVVKNWDAIDLTYGIWKQRTFDGGGYRSKMEDRGDANSNHYNHLHLSYLRTGTPNPRWGEVEGATVRNKPYFESKKRFRKKPFQNGSPLFRYMYNDPREMDGDDDGYGDWTGEKLRKMASGGVAMAATVAQIGEAGREAVIPLNRQGVQVIADAIARYSSSYEARLARSSAYSRSVPSSVVYHSEDHSTRITGDITVESQDPDQMAVMLRRRARRDRLASSRT